MVKKINLFLYGLLLSAFIGAVASFFLFIETILTDFLWQSSRALPNLLVILAGAYLLFLMQRKRPYLPKTAHDSLNELKKEKRAEYRDVFLNLGITLVILCAGAGVGPEAALLSAVISLSIWQADKLRYLYFSYDELRTLPWLVRLKRLASYSKYTHPYTGLLEKNKRKLREKKLLVAMFILNGLFVFAVLLRETDQPSFVTKLGQSNWQLSELWILLPILVFSLLYGFLWHKFDFLLKTLIGHFHVALPLRIALGAMLIFLISQSAPDLLFSGQHSVHLLTSDWKGASFLFLSGMALLKLLFFSWCTEFGWRGGEIFPSLFASMTQGFALSVLFPTIDPLLIVAITATSLGAAILGNALLSGIMVALFCPLSLMPVIVLVVLLLSAAGRIKKRIFSNHKKGL
ncbi:MAG: chloride channel protein [Enterococcaceae bacterium]|jgi:H+/Cl- antiporter ClcA|nr:chloride channel protein [Enterococcaceae bacterium]MCI1919151.1 chloride channel protein [Enterococcaceae bacterium]